jgi:hypothetical protein
MYYPGRSFLSQFLSNWLTFLNGIFILRRISITPGRFASNWVVKRRIYDNPNTSRLVQDHTPIVWTGLDFKSAIFDQVRSEAEDWMKMLGLEI